MTKKTDTTNTSDNICVHAYVSGRVQGVWFRAFTKEQAIKACVTGWAKNLADGRVEVMLAGTRQHVETVIRDLHTGPKLAKVTDIKTDERCYQNFDTFTTS